jgi:ATP-dependent exoDNAse (exonuclease V) alpha subunit
LVGKRSSRPSKSFGHIRAWCQGEIVYISPTRLAAVQTVYAMTIHKSQGSMIQRPWR